jgi:hypothetical protein
MCVLVETCSQSSNVSSLLNLCERLSLIVMCTQASSPNRHMSETVNDILALLDQ